MKAVVYRGIGNLSVEDVPKPTIQAATEVLIKVTLASICGSDLHLKELGPPEIIRPGTIMGHEYCGIIEAVGSEVHYLKKGDRIFGKPFSHCGHCFYCQRHQAELCEKMVVFGSVGAQGVQAEYARIPFAENSLIKIPDALSDEDVLFTGDILPTGYSGVVRGHVAFGDTVAVFGSGPVGLCALACAQLFGPSLVIAVDIQDYRLSYAQSLGAIPIDASREDPVAKIKELTNGRGVDVGIEAAGFEATFRACLQCTRRGGRVSIVGMFVKPTFFNLADRFFDMFTLSIGLGDTSHIEELIKLIEQGKLNLKSMITHRLPLAEALRGYELFEKKLEGCIKVVLEC